MSEPGRYLLDTNHASRFLAAGGALPRRIEQARRRGVQFLLPAPVYGELLYGAYNSSRVGENLAAVASLAEQLGLMSFGRREAEEYGKIAARQRAIGRPVPPVDMQIAAMARVHNCVVLTADKHFAMVDDLRVENWLEVEDVEA